MIKLQCKLQTEYSDSLWSELERIKTKVKNDNRSKFSNLSNWKEEA